MLFLKITFLIVCGAALLLHTILPARWRWTVLLAASLTLYGFWGRWFLVLVCGQILWVWLLGRKLEALPDGRQRRGVLALTIVLPLLSLVFFRFHQVFVAAWQDLFMKVKAGQSPAVWKIIVPLGISFYTFKLISYVMEVYRRRIPAERHPGLLALYITFFPQIICGPIDRPDKLLPQLRQPRGRNWEDLTGGLKLMLWGFFQKLVIADRLAFYINTVFTEAPRGQGLHLLLAVYFYAFQIYCDFSGYSDIAIGLARIFGIDSMANFDRPYLSRSLSQFWTRWHISLSSWLRDYLFLPISYAVLRHIEGERAWGVKAETWAYCIGMWLTMVICGIWHGAAWTFVLWGALHGFYLVFSFVTKKLRKRLVKRFGLKDRPRLHDFLALLSTFHLVTLAWILFRAPSLEHVVKHLKYMQIKYNGKASLHVATNLLTILLFLGLDWARRQLPEKEWFRRIPLPVKLAGYALGLGLVVLFAKEANALIYEVF